MPDHAALIAVLIRARRSGDRPAETDALTRLARHGIRVLSGSATR